MTCKCVFCVFQQDGRCYKKTGKVKIDERGMCSDFIGVKVDEETLIKAKEPTFDTSKVGHINFDELFFSN